jgi:hypothetical protein
MNNPDVEEVFYWRDRCSGMIEKSFPKRRIIEIELPKYN